MTGKIAAHLGSLGESLNDGESPGSSDSVLSRLMPIFSGEVSQLGRGTTACAGGFTLVFSPSRSWQIVITSCFVSLGCGHDFRHFDARCCRATTNCSPEVS